MKSIIITISCLLLMVPIAAGLGFAWDRYCPSITDVVISVNGVQTVATVNRCPNQLIKVSVPGEVTVLVDWENKRASVPNGSAFWEGFGLVFSRDLSPGGVSMTATAKIDRETELRFFENGLSYRDILSGHEIIIKFDGN
ncbi:MAG: hypothetical protein QM785_11945 [Pyrinomonadaceae bacterium]